MDEPYLLYEILEVSPNASQEVIEAAYKRLARKYHPDVGGSNELMAALNEAYRILNDPEIRKAYNEACAASQYANAHNETQETHQVNDYEVVVRPWARYLARTIDLWLVCWVVLIVTILLNVYGILEFGKYQFIISVFVIRLVLESILISDFGTTPGKWILGISVLKFNNTNLSFWEALKRNIYVYVAGEGLSVPVISVFVLLNSYSYLKNYKFTYWDGLLQTKVVHKPIKIVQWIFAWMLLLGLIILTSYIGSLPSN